MPSPLITLTTAVPRVQIIYDFISPAEETFLLQHIDQVGGHDSETANKNKNWGWKSLNGRRSMYWGGTILPKSNTLIPSPFPKFMDQEWPNVLGRISETGVYKEFCSSTATTSSDPLERGPNHCLVNEYLPSQGILPHTDGPAYQPCTTTLSLGSHTILSLRSNPLSQNQSNDNNPLSREEGDNSSTSNSAETPSNSTSTSTSSNREKEEKEKEIEKIEILLPPRSLLILSSTLYKSYLHGIQPFSVSSNDLLKRCVNWDNDDNGWWEYLKSLNKVERDRIDLYELFSFSEVDSDSRSSRSSLEGGTEKCVRDDENDKADMERKKAFLDLKEGLGKLGLLSDDDGRDSTRHKHHSEDQAEIEKDDWINRVQLQRQRIEERGGWPRSKRVSLTCRRVNGKVRGLGGLLGRVGGKNK